MRLRTVLSVVCSVISVFAVAQQKTAKKPAPLTLFSINKKPVSADEFIYLYKKNHQQVPEDYTKEKIDEYFTLYVNFKLKVEEARKRGMDTTRAFQREFNQYKDELRKPYLPGNNLTDSLVRLTYNRMKEEIRASHILITVKPDAAPEDTLLAFNRIIEIRKKLDAGEDFGQLAVQHSEDPSAKLNKGDLNYFTALQMVYPFENAAFSTPVGKVSHPVRTRFGYHLLKVTDRRPAQGEVEVSHIMLRTGEDKNNAQAKNTIFYVFDQLQAGLDWNELCKLYSEDPGTKDNGGRLRPFGINMMSNVPEFERVAFELQKEGQFSDPFETQYGWHIVKLERKIPLAPFEELAPSLKNRVNRDERAQISKQALQTKLRKDLQFNENTAMKSKVMALADSTLQKGNWKAPAFPNAAKEVLFSLRDKKVTVQEFLHYAQRNQTSNAQTPQKYFDDLYNKFVEHSILEVQEKRILSAQPEYGYLLNEYYEGILLFEIMEKEVWNKASEDSVGQHKYYLANKSKYNAGDRVKATFYSASTAQVLTPLREILQDGNEQEIQEYVGQHKVKVESGYYAKSDKAILQHLPWTAGIYSADNNGMYYLAWLKEVLAPGVMSFDEARPTIVSDYQTHLENNWIAQLRSKYPVKVNEKGRKYILQQLQKK